ncbi:hypothetical protein J5N97_019172 [Dioscorea zingiberensis]|uniref:Uncharacterized protein n=1 Tax=Dioscorea zingiberensis TaxID=325984 RepID=A0A9D5CEF7_9LILI|nr:hypothetical protein J5N97_019172 [Dioscorea zingiberensis]
MDRSAEEAAAELKKGFQTLEIVQKDPAVPVWFIYLNRPAQRNALSVPFFSELPRAIALLDRLPSARAIVLSARGPHFCSGIDLSSLQSITASSNADPAAAAEELRRRILELQSAISALERCRKPVVAAIQGACVGGGVDLVAACDLRCCEDKAYFVVKEVDLGLVADLGTLQRLPTIVGFGNAMDLALTGRKVGAREAKAMGLVSRVFSGPAEMDEAVFALAKELAMKPALALMGTKAVMLKSRDIAVEKGLDYVATWNAGMLRSRELEDSVRAQLQKLKPGLSKM